MVSMGRSFLPAGGPSYFCAPGLLSLLTNPHAGLCKKPAVVTPFDGADAPGDEDDEIAANDAASADEQYLQEEGQEVPGEGLLLPSHGEHEEGRKNPGEGSLRPSHGDECPKEHHSDGTLVLDQREATPIVCRIQSKILIGLLAAMEDCCDDGFFCLSSAYSLQYAYANSIIPQAIILLAIPRVDPKVKKKSSLLMCIFIDLPFHPGEHTMNFIGANKCDDHADDQPTDDAFIDVNSPDGEQDNNASKAAADSDGAISYEAVTSDADEQKVDDEVGSSNTTDDREAGDAENDTDADEETGSDNEPSDAENKDPDDDDDGADVEDLDDEDDGENDNSENSDNDAGSDDEKQDGADDGAADPHAVWESRHEGHKRKFLISYEANAESANPAKLDANMLGFFPLCFPTRLRGRNGSQAYGKPNVRVNTEAELDVFFHEKSNLDPG